MTRLEYENKTPDQLGEMQDEILQLKKQLKHKQSKKFLNCTSCSVILIFVFIILGAALAAVMAKSGLWQLPFFSDYFYHQPEPVYQVADSKFTEADLISRLQKLAVAEAIKQGKRSNLNLNFEISEAELTALLRSQAVKNQALADKIESWQIAVSADSAQLFLKAKSPKNLIVTLDFVPGIKDGKLNLDVKRFKVGDLGMPKFLGSMLVENMGANTLNSLLSSFSLVGKIENIIPEDHKLKVGILIYNLNF
jgi:hypothetical protein